MRKCFLVSFFSFALVQLACAASTSVVDSVGTVVKNGKTFILHKVEPKQTLYGLARQYGVPVTAVQQANPGLTSLAVGQTVFVPGRERVTSSNTASATRPVAAAPETTLPPTTAINGVASSSGTREHQVEARQTLYAIARQYNVSPADLKKWNNLTSDNLQEGQTLLVAPPAANAATASVTTTSPAADETDAAAPVVATTRPAAKPATAAVTTRESAPVKVERTETRVSENLSRISESGLAEVMDKSEGSKYLALHKTAPVGTILQVKNTLNNQSVYVRVSGKLPEGTDNDRVIIKLSKRAYQKLAATASRFQVEVNYMP
ncbi:LysM peptidoglycan-binding domain-containing protein [Adhaeribacter swui]|uniref:LysM peptidoglycan-binding domain-containing protein n=1 Tax=Adhaeribacter swui TaxID=2086471 RepID=A0A7G7G2N7_9BACT|nr:LysM peptidoglycan-binding domain-containing protein [Adhaeribacter swui]QNF31421.1 LysM peptidoglycan-binding domain-containing protein [Adhaeribacter swui]